MQTVESGFLLNRRAPRCILTLNKIPHRQLCELHTFPRICLHSAGAAALTQRCKSPSLGAKPMASASFSHTQRYGCDYTPVPGSTTVKLHRTFKNIRCVAYHLILLRSSLPLNASVHSASSRPVLRRAHPPPHKASVMLPSDRMSTMS